MMDEHNRGLSKTYNVFKTWCGGTVLQKKGMCCNDMCLAMAKMKMNLETLLSVIGSPIPFHILVGSNTFFNNLFKKFITF